MLIIFFILGLIIGSFLNVVICRMDLAETILGRSMCPHCKNKIRWYDNIPLLSFIILKTKCRDCQEKISWQYPLVEFFTGLIFVLVGNYFFSNLDVQSWIATAFYCILFSVLIVIFVYDLKFMEIPMLMIWIGVGITAMFYLFFSRMSFGSGSEFLSLNLVSGIIGGVAAFLFFFLLAAISKEKWMGMGDAYLGFLAGFVVGWPAVLFSLMSSFFIGSVIGIILIIFKKKTMKSQIPFAPFLVLGILLAVILPKMFPVLEYYYLFFY